MPSPLRPFLATLYEKLEPVTAHTASRAGHHVTAAFLVAAVTAVRLLFDPWFGSSVPFVPYFPVVTAAAWFGGIGPGLLATVLILGAADYFFVDPRFDFRVPDARTGLQLALFGGSNVLIILRNAPRQALRPPRRADPGLAGRLLALRTQADRPARADHGRRHLGPAARPRGPFFARPGCFPPADSVGPSVPPLLPGSRRPPATGPDAL